MATLYIFFPYRPLCVNFLPWPFAPHIFTIAVLITVCALGHMHDNLTRTCSPLTFITTCCSENVPWWTSCAFLPPSVFCLVTPIAPLFILTSLDEWGSVFVCCRLEFSVWSLMGFGFLWPPRHVLLQFDCVCLTHLIVQQQTYCPAKGTGLVKYRDLEGHFGHNKQGTFHLFPCLRAW